VTSGVRPLSSSAPGDGLSYAPAPSHRIARAFHRLAPPVRCPRLLLQYLWFLRRSFNQHLDVILRACRTSDFSILCFSSSGFAILTIGASVRVCLRLFFKSSAIFGPPFLPSQLNKDLIARPIWEGGKPLSPISFFRVFSQALQFAMQSPKIMASYKYRHCTALAHPPHSCSRAPFPETYLHRKDL